MTIKFGRRKLLYYTMCHLRIVTIKTRITKNSNWHKAYRGLKKKFSRFHSLLKIKSTDASQACVNFVNWEEKIYNVIIAENFKKRNCYIKQECLMPQQSNIHTKSRSLQKSKNKIYGKSDITRGLGQQKNSCNFSTLNVKTSSKQDTNGLGIPG